MKSGAWRLALAGAIGAVCSGLAVGYIAWRLLTPRDTPDQAALMASLVHLNEATSQGVSVGDFSSMLIDVKTKFDMAEGSLPTAARKNVAAAIQKENDVLLIWASSLKMEYVCPLQCEDTLAAPMLDLGLIKGGGKAYNHFFQGVTRNFHDDDDSRSMLISAALNAASADMAAAILSLRSGD